MDATDTLPAEPEAERYVIGAIVAFPEAADVACKQLCGVDFFDRALGAIFDRAAIYHAGDGINPVLIGRDLKHHKEFVGISAAALMLELAQPDKVPTPLHVAAECKKIVAAREKRQLFEIADNARSAALNGQASEDVYGMLRGDLWEYERAAASKGEPRFRAIDAVELASSKFDLHYLIDGLLAQWQPAFLGGPKKSLKTSLGMDLGLSLATNGYFLGKFRVNDRRRVVFMSGESAEATHQETAQRICRAMGIDLAAIEGFTLCTTLPRLDDAADLAECERFLIDCEAEVVIFDPLYFMLTGDDAGNLFKQGALLRNANQMCRRIGATDIYCHHTRSTIANPYAPGELDNLAWAGCAEFARQWLLVSRREQYEPGSGQHRLWLTAGGSAGHSGLWAVDVNEGRQTDLEGRQWTVSVESATAAKASAAERKEQEAEERQRGQLDLDRAAACRVLAKSAAGLSKSAIGDRAGIPTRRWPKVFAAMLDAGELVTCEIKVSNHKRPIEGYKLPESEAV